MGEYEKSSYFCHLSLIEISRIIGMPKLILQRVNFLEEEGNLPVLEDSLVNNNAISHLLHLRPRNLSQLMYEDDWKGVGYPINTYIYVCIRSC